MSTEAAEILDTTAPPPKAPPPTMLRPEDDEDEPDKPAAAPADKAPEGEPKVDAAATPTQPEEKNEVVAEVMKRRDTRELAALVREKKSLEAERAKYKDYEEKRAKLAKMERLLEDEDDAAAFEALLELKHGDKASARLPVSYNALTERVLQKQGGSQPASKAERGVSRLERQLEEVQAREAQTRAKLEQKEAEELEHKVLGAKAVLGQFLKDNSNEFEALLLEADQPEEIVWEILDEAEKKGQSLTAGEAAALANQYFQPAFQRKAQRYKNSPAPNTANEVPTKPEAPTSKSAPPRKSLTNADASQVTDAKKPPPPKNEDERRARGWQVLKRGSSK